MQLRNEDPPDSEIVHHHNPLLSLYVNQDDPRISYSCNLSSQTESMDKNDNQLMKMTSTANETQGTVISCDMELPDYGDDKIFPNDMVIQVRHHEDERKLFF